MRPKPQGARLRTPHGETDVQNRMHYSGRRYGIHIWTITLTPDEMRSLTQGETQFLCDVMPGRTGITFVHGNIR